MLYEVELEDGTTKTYGTNVTAENMWNTVNNEAYYEDTLDSIVDAQFDKNTVENGFYHNRIGKRKVMKTT